MDFVIALELDPMTRPTMKSYAKALIQTEEITRFIRVLRGHRVLLDTELAALYGVTTKRFNELNRPGKSGDSVV